MTQTQDGVSVVTEYDWADRVLSRTATDVQTGAVLESQLAWQGRAMAAIWRVSAARAPELLK